jgi:hypothetical protein
MELSSQEVIRALMRGSGMAVRAGRRRGAQVAARPAAGGARRIHCRCGRCRQCLDNARWERIFAEKFADPNYYTRPAVRCVSPLTSL